MANAADSYEFNNNNVFDNWDLNPLAMQVGAGADGVRDTLSTKRDAFLQPKMQEYRDKVGPGHADATDQTLFGDQNFQNYVKTGQVPTAQPQSVTQQWTAPAATPQVAPAVNDGRSSALWDTLWKQATQNTTPDRNDPAIRAQADAYAANETRAQRDSINDLAEKSGPNANLRGETRLAAEHAGQRTGAFEANLVGQELKAKRDQVAQALTQAQGRLSQEEQMALQERLANLDAALKQQGLNLQDKGINNDMEKALLNNDATLRELGLNEWDRTNYWDALKSGYLG